MFGIQPIYSSDQLNVYNLGKVVAMLTGAYMTYKAASSLFSSSRNSQLATPVAWQQRDRSQVRRGAKAKERRVYVFETVTMPINVGDCRYNLYKLRVLNQELAIGGEWACGYHSLKNVLYVLHGLQNDHEISSKISNNLQNKQVWQDLFEKSWLPYDKAHIQAEQKGMYSDSMVTMLQDLQQGNVQLPDGIIDTRLEQSIIPVVGYTLSAYTPEQQAKIQMLFRKFQNKQIRSIAFIAAQNRQHFAGYVFHQDDAGIKIYIVDSLNSDIKNDAKTVQNLLTWYQESV